jgi:cell division protein FtsI (penicillin-binding protein 3)
VKKKKVFAKDGGTRAKKKRVAAVVLLFFLAFAALVYRGLHLHLSRDPKLARIARSQYRTKIPEVPPRGNIYDAAGDELAVSVPSYALAVRPSKVRDKTALAAKLKSALKMPAKELEAKLASEKKYVWVKRYLSPREKEDIEASLKDLAPDGVEMVKGTKRFYPNREVASQILGAVGIDNEGLSGIELFYDRDLQGSAEDSTAYRDARGRTFQTLETLGSSREAREPNHLHLTIRRNIQYVAEQELERTCGKYKAKTCTAIVLDPATGSVLAMASYPSFNPNAYQSYDAGAWRNVAVTDAFEPGSTFKPILAAAALEAGAVGPNDKFFCENGDLKIGKHVIHDHEKYGMLSVRQIIKVSSNIGIYKVGKKLGKKAFAETVEKFGFGRKSGIDYPGEIPGSVRPSKSWQEIDFANVSFGQGLLATPLQMASAYAALANGGVRMKPRVVSRITDAEGRTIHENEPEEAGRAVGPETARLMLEIMKGVTEEGGTATRAALPGYTVAGKTGTAQKVVNGRYSHDKYASSFVGVVPADRPRFVVLVMVDEPKGEIYGGLVAAPVFREIAWAALSDLGVPPATDAGRPLTAGGGGSTRRREPEGEKSPPKSEMAKKLASLILPAALTGDAAPFPQTVPDFRGLSKRKVLAILDDRKLKCRVTGSGVAESQFPSPGSPVPKGEGCKIVFRAD